MVQPMPTPLWQHICDQIATTTGGRNQLGASTGMAGGCINQAQRIECGGSPYFVKLNRPELADMFEAEAEGLQEMADSGTIRVPQPVCWGSTVDHAYLVLEHLPLGGNGSQAQLGEQLAAMHRITRPRYGWQRDNTIGSTPQPNKPSNDWIGFWREQRLGFQLELAARHGFGGRLQTLGGQLLEQFPALFDNPSPPAAMLHGDLWSGNYSFTQNGEPVIFDPAFYYGDRETDIAMTELFGGFRQDFYAAYEHSYPLDVGYRVRKDFYNLYHILNHANLFGGGYARQAQGMMERLLSEL